MITSGPCVVVAGERTLRFRRSLTYNQKCFIPLDKTSPLRVGLGSLGVLQLFATRPVLVLMQILASTIVLCEVAICDGSVLWFILIAQCFYQMLPLLGNSDSPVSEAFSESWPTALEEWAHSSADSLLHLTLGEYKYGQRCMVILHTLVVSPFLFSSCALFSASSSF